MVNFCTNINPYPTAFPYGNGMVLHFYQQQESSTTKTVHKVINKGLNPYPTAFPYGNGMVLHFYQQQESSTTKTVHKVINKGLKAYV